MRKKNAILKRQSCMKIRSFKSWRKITSQSTQQNYFSSAKPGGGPAASMEELSEILQKHGEIAEKVVQTEVSYYRDTHKTEISY